MGLPAIGGRLAFFAIFFSSWTRLKLRGTPSLDDCHPGNKLPQLIIPHDQQHTPWDDPVLLVISHAVNSRTYNKTIPLCKDTKNQGTPDILPSKKEFEKDKSLPQWTGIEDGKVDGLMTVHICWEVVANLADQEMEAGFDKTGTAACS